MERASGILMHITSLPEDEGIGTFGRSAYEFADFLKAAGQKYWQILPLGPVGYGNSPYQSFSAFAGNPYLIDLRKLQEEGLLSKRQSLVLDKENDDPEQTDFEKIGPLKLKILHKAYNESKKHGEIIEAVEKFVRENADWINDYSLFMAIKENQKGLPWTKWKKPLKLRDQKALKEAEEKLKEKIDFWNFVQYEFSKQWAELKAYINKCGIRVIGDIPIYVAGDSSDAWAHKELFKMDPEGNPLTVAGCPPDAFSDDGQLWGNPIYDWEYHEKTDFKWWVSRIEHNARLYDMIRIDHFRGFEAFWEVPAEDKTARNGQWTKGPGYKLFKAINKKNRKVKIIAEDLGVITKEVTDLRKKAGYPGMAVLEFAFDPEGESSYLPHNCEKDCVAYIGTHDNETIAGWMKNPVNKKEADFARHYLRLNSRETYHWGFIRGLLATPCDLAIIQMQDLLGLDNRARMNTPSTVGENWKWRMKKDAVDDKAIKKLKQLTRLYGRGQKVEQRNIKK